MGKGGGKSAARGGGGSGASTNVDERVRSSRDYVGQREVESQIEDQLNYSLSSGEEDARVDSFRIISNPGNGRTGDVEAQYHVDVRVPVGRDPETGVMEYDYDTEYRSETFQVVLRNRR